MKMRGPRGNIPKLSQADALEATELTDNPKTRFSTEPLGEGRKVPENSKGPFPREGAVGMGSGSPLSPGTTGSGLPNEGQDSRGPGPPAARRLLVPSLLLLPDRLMVGQRFLVP